VTASYIQTCDGDACYTLWRKYIHALNHATDLYYEVADVGYLADAAAGRTAQALAKKICGLKITGDTEWVETISVAENRLLTPLKELQQAAGLTDVAWCKKVVQ
jgi:hypothetical protein